MLNHALLLAVLALSYCLVGCARMPAKAAPVDPDKARLALKTALDAWQAGQKIESLSAASPEIIAQDFDWMQGKKLAAYKVLGDGVAQDANLRIDVELSLGNDVASAATKRVAYIVGTDPKLTVFRSFD